MEQQAAFCVCLLIGFLPAGGAHADDERPRGQALVLVDARVSPQVEAGLRTYAAPVRKLHGIEVMPRPDAYYQRRPGEIRAPLAWAYRESATQLVGAAHARCE